MGYKRLVINGADGGADWEDFTAAEAAEKDALATATASAATDNFQRKLRRYQAVQRLKTIAAGQSQLAPIAADMLRLLLIEFTDPDPGAPTS